MSNKNIMLLGGSFDPIHNGHLQIAKTALEQSGCDEVWFVIAKEAPLKSRVLTDSFHRIQMMKYALKNYRRFYCCLVEFELPTPSYTIDTVMHLRKLYPSYQWHFCIGEDQANQFDQWKDAEKLLQMCQFWVYPRTGLAVDSRFKDLQGPPIKVSSTAIRQGQSWDAPRLVLRYLIANNLYSRTMIEANLSKKRVKHIYAVEQLSVKLAHRWGVDANKASCAAFFHDWCKEFDPKELELWMKLAHPNQLHLPTALWHAYVAQAICKRRYHCQDKEVLQAIACHVTGSSNSLLAKIIYVADKIEPNRSFDTSHLSTLAFNDIHKAVRVIKSTQAKHVNRTVKNDNY